MSGKIFNCPHCSITYKQERFLVKHISTKHNLEPNQTTNTLTQLQPDNNTTTPVQKVKKVNKKPDNNKSTQPQPTVITTTSIKQTESFKSEYEKALKSEAIQIKLKNMNEKCEKLFRYIIYNNNENSDINTRPINIEDCNYLLNVFVNQINQGLLLKKILDEYVDLNNLAND